MTASISVVFTESAQAVAPGSGRDDGSTEDVHILGQSAGMKVNDSMDLKNEKGKATQFNASQGEAGQPSRSPTVRTDDNGQAQAELDPPPSPGTLITTTDNLLSTVRVAGQDSKRMNMSEAQTAKEQVSVVKIPPAIGKVIHLVEDLYKEDGEPDDLWCRVEEEAPNE